MSASLGCFVAVATAATDATDRLGIDGGPSSIVSGGAGSDGGSGGETISAAHAELRSRIAIDTQRMPR